LELIPNGPLLHINENNEVVINQNFKAEKFNKYNFSEDELRDLSRDMVSGLYYCKILIIIKYILIILFMVISNLIIFY